MSEDRFQADLSLILRVPYPLVFVRSHEERAHLALIQTIAANNGRSVETWSCVQGFERSPSMERGPFPDPPTSRDTLGLGLDHIARSTVQTVFVLLDPGAQLADPQNARALTELIPQLEARGQSVVVLSNQPTIPQSLLRHSTRVNAPLPSRETLGALLLEVLPHQTYPLLPRERIIAATLGLTRGEATRAWQRAALSFADQDNPILYDWESAVLVEKKRAIANDEVAEFVENDEDLDNVGGLDELKMWLETRHAAFSNEAREFGLPAPRGLLLVGVQGCGKSLVAKAVARHWRLPLLRLDLGAVFAGVHPPDAALHRALEVAEAMAPSVLWTDEIEKGFADSAGTASRVLGSLLTWLQEKRSEVFFVATANDVTDLPPELLRKGRFDEMFFVDLPDRQARAHIFGIHIEKRDRNPDSFNLDALADVTENFSGAEIEQVVTAALYEAFAEGRDLQTRDVMMVIEDTVPLYATRQDDIKRLREWARTRARFAAANRRMVDFFDP